MTSAYEGQNFTDPREAFVNEHIIRNSWRAKFGSTVPPGLIFNVDNIPSTKLR